MLKITSPSTRSKS